MPDALVTDSRRIPSVSAERLGKFDRLITYKVGAGPAALLIMHDEDANEQGIAAAIKRDVELNSQHVGKTFSI